MTTNKTKCDRLPIANTTETLIIAIHSSYPGGWRKNTYLIKHPI